jgi:hypothetical protein
MKRLVICCDGTWQRLYGEHLTNVALTARAVASRDAKGQPQIVYYSAGVGASLSGLSLWNGMTGIFCRTSRAVAARAAGIRACRERVARADADGGAERSCAGGLPQ